MRAMWRANGRRPDAVQVMRDALTGLPSRAVLVDRVDHALRRSTRTHRHVAVVVVDIDDFRSLNATYGQAVGDEILVALADRLTSCSRASDTVARSGDDEFTIVLEDLATPAGAYDFGARVLEAMADPLVLSSRQVVITLRLGIAVADPGHRPTDLLAEAALAMGRAADGVRNRYQVFEAGMRAAAEERLALRADLADALSVGREIVPYYQPIVDLATRKVTGYEGLVRWNHPQFGVLTPDRFLGVAEHAGLMDELGRHMVATACADAVAHWSDDISVAVNISADELQGRKLLGAVDEALIESGMRAGRLTLEVTETSVIADVGAAAATLDRLAELGLVLSVDDFGTGHASLTYLERFPVTQIKIDRSFVRRIADEAGRRLVAGVLALAHTLGHEVVAEGVETEAEADALVALGCRLAQGYLFGRPAPLEALVQTRTAPR